MSIEFHQIRLNGFRYNLNMDDGQTLSYHQAKCITFITKQAYIYNKNMCVYNTIYRKKRSIVYGDGEATSV